MAAGAVASKGSAVKGSGFDQTASFVCQFVHQINSKGVWHGDDPLAFSLPLLLLQVSIITILTRSIYHLLRPLGQPLVVSQILGGLIIGPSLLGHNEKFAAKMFPPKMRMVVDTLSLFGFLLFIFLTGVKIDLTVVLKSSRKTMAVGILSFFVPYTLSGLLILVFAHFISFDTTISDTFPEVLALLSLTAFPVVTCFLTELNILNSEVGRLASTSSVICDACHWLVVSIMHAVKVATKTSIRSMICSFFSGTLLISFIVFGARPAALWTIRRTPEGKAVKDVYILAVFVVLMGCALAGEFVGLSSVVASFLLGLVIPDGPPLAAALVERFDCFVSVILLPIFFIMCGSRVDIFSIQSPKNVAVILSVVLVSFLGKAAGAVVPPLFFRMPVRDAVSLALIMNSKGIIELAVLADLNRSKGMNKECFAVMSMSVVVVTMMVSPIIKVMYEPSRGYVAYKRRTVFHTRSEGDLRVLACVHTQDDVRALLALLRTSRPLLFSLTALHLVNLVGRSSSILVNHRPRPTPSRSDRIFDAFKTHSPELGGAPAVQCVKAVCPYPAMHNDICSVALERRTALILLPFPRRRVVLGDWAGSPGFFRRLNRNVLNKAPCSVGVLIEPPNQRRDSRPPPSPQRVVCLFFGGADDREALAYVGRMSAGPEATRTAVRFRGAAGAGEVVGGTERSRTLDREMLAGCGAEGGVGYREEVVADGGGVAAAVRAAGGAHELVVVGRRHGESRVMGEVRRRNQQNDMGEIGELLMATQADGGAAVLVVQQQQRVWGMHDPEESSHLRRVNL